ncbi:hypothetical protein Hte_011124 [Hypoxylon texense]
MGSSKTPDPNNKYRATVSSPTSSDEHPKHNTTARDTSRETTRDTTRDTRVPVQQPDKDPRASTNSSSSQSKARPQSAYQNPGSGFDHTVTNVPGVGLVYNNQPGQPYNGYNPASAHQQPQQHQIPGVANHHTPQVLPPGFAQIPQIPQVPQFFTQSLGHQTQPTMAYNITSMPSQGQHFQPPVPDTTYGPIPHTYHPRFDSDNSGNQFVTIDGTLYQVQQAQAATGAETQVYYVPVQQGTTGNSSQPVLVQVQAGQQPQQPPVFVQGASGNSTGPIMVQAPAGQQQPVYVQVQGQGAGQVGAQPGTFPGMISQPQAVGGSGYPDVMGIGKTGTEIQIDQYHTAMNSKALEGQDIAPADPDPSRMYYCREHDGEWTLRNRYGIDSLGDCRWYVMPGGIFYAVRMAD